ncbi:DUF1330 domain-containing protein [Streptomyces viridosporus]|uniref:DUF1330 domain-containing protein n=1 Tax=Streptomyces viridosporus TaxID=67581 RepID=UPI0034426228
MTAQDATSTTQSGKRPPEASPGATGGDLNAYVIARMGFPARPQEDLAEYMERLLPTMKPFGGHILSHGKEVENLEGVWPGYAVVLGFPDVARAHAWYNSPEYQKIMPLRRRHVDGELIVVEGNPPGYDATGAAAAMRRGILAGAPGTNKK